MTLERAIEVFVGGFTQVKSTPHPYVAERRNGLWVMRDGPGRKQPRKIEVVTTGMAPREAVERIAEAKLGWHFVCAIEPPQADHESVRSGYKGLGYRVLSSEWMFVHDLKSIDTLTCQPPVRLIGSQEELSEIRQCAPQKRKFRPGIRMYGSWDDVRDYGWVHSVPVGQDTWVSDLYVYKEYRGRGYGRALMSAMLLEDRAHGVDHSVLLASSDGARLYPHLGYEMIGILHLLCPTSRNSA